MKYVLICALLAVPLALADETTKMAKVEELLTVMNVEQQQKVMMDQMSDAITGQMKEQLAQQGNVSAAEMAKMEERQKKLFALIKEHTTWQKMKPVFVKAYADTFSEPEVDAILAFYKSPAGKAMVDKQPTLNAKILASVQSQMSDLAM